MAQQFGCDLKRAPGDCSRSAAVVSTIGTRRRRAKLQLVTAPFCAMCLEAGIVHPAEIADRIVSHRGGVNSSPTWRSTIWIRPRRSHFRSRVRHCLLQRSRVRKPKEETAWNGMVTPDVSSDDASA